MTCALLALNACTDSVYIADPSADAAVDPHPAVDAGAQDLLIRDRSISDSAAPDSAAPDSAAPDTAAPDSAAPDAAVPDTAAPDAAVPDSAAPDAAAPDTAAPDRAAPDTAAPDMSRPPDAGITTVELPPVADAWLRQGSPDSPGGDSTELAVGFCTGTSNGNMRTWLRFDLSALPQGVSVLSAAVELYFYTHWGAQDYPIHLSAEDGWGENIITWSNQPAYASEVLDTVAAFTEDEVWRSWDVSPAVLQELASDGLISLVIEGETLFDPVSATDDAESWAYSKEHENSALAPHLVVSYHIP